MVACGGRHRRHHHNREGGHAMKAKLQETPPYVPSGKIRLTITERKNGFDESRLESYLREACGTEFSFCMERLNRAKWRHKECGSRERLSPLRGSARSA